MALFAELSTTEQLIRQRVSRALPRGMEISQFSVLNHLHSAGTERTPAQLARLFNVTKGAMTNTVVRLEAAGFVHVRPDWEDGRQKLVSISPAGAKAREAAVEAVTPELMQIVAGAGEESLRASLPVLRKLRQALVRKAGKDD